MVYEWYIFLVKAGREPASGEAGAFNISGTIAPHAASMAVEKDAIV